MNKQNKKYIIGGVGYKSLTHNQITKNIFDSSDVKINIGTAIAKKFVENDYNVILLARSKDKLIDIKQSLESYFPDSKSLIEISNVDLLNTESANEFIGNLDNNFEYGYIHSSGLSSGSYNFSNPYLEVEKIPEDLPTLEFEAVTKSLLIMIKGLLSIFNNQNNSKVVVVNSMSGIRPYPLGYSHSSAKAGLHNAVRSLTLELTKRNIFITEVNPGMVDTGHYDTKEVQDAILKICKSFGYEYDKLPLMPPDSVAEAVLLSLESKAHLLNINLVAEGQIPYNGA